MIFENSDLSEQINEIESIPEGIIESLGEEKDIFDNKISTQCSSHAHYRNLIRISRLIYCDT